MRSFRRNHVVLATALMLAGAGYLGACGGDGTGPEPPEVRDCDTIAYDGQTYNFGFGTGCGIAGVASFTSTITQAGKTVCFEVTCSGGCINTVRLCSN